MALAAISLALLGSQTEQQQLQTMLTVLTQILKPSLSGIGIGFARERQEGPRPKTAAGDWSVSPDQLRSQLLRVTAEMNGRGLSVDCSASQRRRSPAARCCR
jgi:hypothetical protein